MTRLGSGKTVVILIPELAADAGPDEQDALVQAETVSKALTALGYRPLTQAVSLDLATARRQIEAESPAFVFNLVESLEGQGRLIHLVPALLDSMGIAYTGCGTEAMFATSGKILAKHRLQGAGIATPEWIEPGALAGQQHREGPWIVKSVWEHASIGIDASAIVADTAAIPAAVAARQARYGGDWFAERYIDGREFNLALLAGPDNPSVLPPAEMCFRDYPAGKPRIVDYAAKWHADSFEFNNTVRNFEFGGQDDALIERLSEIARSCWHLFDLHGYARVDFRVDRTGVPWVLEINANPCIAPDAGFIAAAARAGLPIVEVVRRICADLRQVPRPLTGTDDDPTSALVAACEPRAARN